MKHAQVNTGVQISVYMQLTNNVESKTFLLRF